MNKEVQAWLLTMPKSALDWLDSLRNRNPLKGSNGGANQNSVFVEIGKNLIVDTIHEMRNNLINPPAKNRNVSSGSEILGGVSI